MSAFRDRYGYFIVAVKRGEKLVATVSFDTKKQAVAWAKERRAKKDGVKLSISQVKGKDSA